MPGPPASGTGIPPQYPPGGPFGYPPGGGSMGGGPRRRPGGVPGPWSGTGRSRGRPPDFGFPPGQGPRGCGCAPTLFLVFALVLAIPVLLFFLPSLLPGDSGLPTPDVPPRATQDAIDDEWGYPPAAPGSTATATGSGTGTGSASVPGPGTGPTVATRDCTPFSSGPYGRVSVGGGATCEIGKAVQQAYAASSPGRRAESLPVVVWDREGRRPLVYTCTGTSIVQCTSQGTAVVQLAPAASYLAT